MQVVEQLDGGRLAGASLTKDLQAEHSRFRHGWGTEKV